MPKRTRQTTTQSSSDATAPKAGRKTSIPLKCQKCAMMSAAQAKLLHGPDGDGCWNAEVCYSRRSHARHRDRRNLARRKPSTLTECEEISIPPDVQPYWGVLVVYRSRGGDTPVHALGMEIWQGQEKCAVVRPIHCGGLMPSQIHSYLEKVLEQLETNYGIKKFYSQEILAPELCPLRPCPLHPQV